MSELPLNQERNTKTESTESIQDSEISQRIRNGKALGVNYSKLSDIDLKRNVTSVFDRLLISLRAGLGFSENYEPYYYCFPLITGPDDSYEAKLIFSSLPDTESVLEAHGFSRLHIMRTETLGNWSIREATYCEGSGEVTATVSLHSYCSHSGVNQHQFYVRFSSLVDDRLIITSNQRHYLEKDNPIEFQTEYLDVEVGDLLIAHVARIAALNTESMTDLSCVTEIQKKAEAHFNGILTSVFFEQIPEELFKESIAKTFATHCPRCGTLRLVNQRFWACDLCYRCGQRQVAELQFAEKRSWIIRLTLTCLLFSAPSLLYFSGLYATPAALLPEYTIHSTVVILMIGLIAWQALLLKKTSGPAFLRG